MIVTEAGLHFCMSELNRNLAGELFVFWDLGPFVQSNVGARGRKGMCAFASLAADLILAQGWVRGGV